MMKARDYSIEWNEILGDMMDDVREDQERTAVHEAIADEQELTDEIVDAWSDLWKLQNNA